MSVRKISKVLKITSISYLIRHLYSRHPVTGCNSKFTSIIQEETGCIDGKSSISSHIARQELPYNLLHIPNDFFIKLSRPSGRSHYSSKTFSVFTSLLNQITACRSMKSRSLNTRKESLMKWMPL